MNYEAIQKSSNQQIDYLQHHFNSEIFNSDYLQQSKSNNQYFINRQYRRDEESSYDRRDDYRQNKFRDKSNDRFQNLRFKKYFVCNKLAC